MPDRPGLRLSPLDLYAEEAMRTLLYAWLWQHRVAGYGEIFPRLPNAVADAWPNQGDVRGTDRTLLTPIGATDWERLEQVLNRHAYPQLVEKVRARKQQLGNLSRCPSCDREAELFTPLDGGFFARCQCGSTWELRDRQFVLTDTKMKDPSFASLGRRPLRIAT